MSSLYELKASYQALMERLYDDELPEGAVIDTLDSIEGAIEEKAEGYSKIIRQMEADIEANKAEEKRLANRRKVLENRKEALKENLFNAMKAVGTAKIRAGLFTVSIQKNGGKRKVALDVETAALPHQFLEVELSPDKEALRRYMEEQGVESCEYCHLEEQGESLRIR